MRTDLGDVAALSDLYDNVDTLEATAANTTWMDLTTIGPRVTVRRSGLYAISWGAVAYGAVANTDRYMGLLIDAVNPTVLTANSLSFGGATYTAGTLVASSKTMHFGLTAGSVVGCAYRGNASGAGQFRERWLSLRPIRIT